MAEKMERIEGEVKKEWPKLVSGASGIATLIGLCVTLGGGVTWLVRHHQQSEARKAQMVLSETQSQQGDYQAAAETYGGILKDDPTDKPALDGQLSAAEAWVENFDVSDADGQDPAAAAGKMLDQIMPILVAGMARAQAAPAKADIEAHVGWAHFLNEKIAERESDTAAESDLRAALKLDPNNVYANAMLGNWLLQKNGDFNEAIHCFALAAATGKERPLVRTYELDGLLGVEHTGAHAELVRVANAMRKDGEPLDEEDKIRILNLCFTLGATSYEEFSEALRAIPPDEERLTYQWLDANESDDNRQTDGRFVEANLLEVEGQRAEALKQFQELKKELKDSPGPLKDQVDAAIRRLRG
jgi:tetratricopeptide (TPR) repeat protein